MDYIEKDMSFSLYIDKNDDNDDDSNEDNENFQMITAATPPDPFPGIAKRIREKWVPDSSANKCNKCQSNFRIYRRRRHCRNCGRIFCTVCSDFKSKIPRAIEKIPTRSGHEEAINYETSVRLCEECHEHYQHIFKLEKLLKIFSLIDFTLHDFKTILMVCKEWRHVGMFYLSKFREIQYKLPYSEYNQWEKDALWRNRKILKGHNLWETHVLRSVRGDHEKVCYIIRLYYISVSESRSCIIRNRCDRTSDSTRVNITD